MLRLGLTGGIATGKSTVAAMFVALGAHLVDTDQLARQAVAPGSPGLKTLVQAFGPGILDQEGGLDRRGLRALAFGDPQVLQRLNAIVHPLVGQLVAQELARLEALDPQGVALVDVPLLFETGWQERFAPVILVYAPAAVQVERLMARDGVDRQAAQQALAAQLPIEEKRRLAQFVVDNSGGLDETRTQVGAVWTQVCALAASHPSRS